VVGIEKRKVNWVLDADIRAFFDTLSHDWLVKFVEHRIADRRVVRLIQKWLSAGVLEDGKRTRSEEGTVQGGSISPLLSNLYLHYVFDLWVHRWRKRQASGDVIVVRYADDFVMGFQHRHEAERFLAELRDRFATFGLELHPEKTRLVEFGRFAAENRRRRGERKPETVDFLGFTHACSTTRRGQFAVRRLTMKRKMRAKLAELKVELWRRMHHPVREQGAYLHSVVRGHFRYYGVPNNMPRLQMFARQVVRVWLRTLRRRSQMHRLPWSACQKLWPHLPAPRVCHPWPHQRFGVITQGRSRMR